MKARFSTGRLSLWLGGAALAFFTFIRITRELIEGDVNALDRAILLAVDKTRTPALTVSAIDVTALGSTTLVVLFSLFALVLLLALRHRVAAFQLVTASAGAGILTVATKDIVERIRPDEGQRLIAVSGFSYPSGHSVAAAALYLTIAIIAGRYVEHAGARVAMFVAVSLVLIMVGASRVYLGVHYATECGEWHLIGRGVGAAARRTLLHRWWPTLVLSVRCHPVTDRSVQKSLAR